MQATTITVEREVPTVTVERRPVQVLVPDFSDRVERGAALLKRLFGDDILDNVETSSLDLQSAASCVLGQVFVEGIVNGATRYAAAISGYGDSTQENYFGGLNFLFPKHAYAHLDGLPYVHADDASRHHGFLINEQDVDEWDRVIGYEERYDDLDGEWIEVTEHEAGGRGEKYLYEELTRAWVEYLSAELIEREPVERSEPSCPCGEDHGDLF